MNDKELQLQRLVDSQLNLEETLELLRLAEQEPDLWREIAAAFVEDQMWRAEITLEGQADSLVDEERDDVASRGRSASAADSSQGPKFWMALAAAVVVGLGLGLIWDSQGNPSGGTMTPVVNQDTNPETVLPEDDDSHSQTPTPQMVSNFEPAHQLSMGEAGNVPLFTLDQAREMGFLKEQSLPQETVDQLRERGFQLEQDTQYISGKAQDGRRVLVPVRSVRLSRGN